MTTNNNRHARPLASGLLAFLGLALLTGCGGGNGGGDPFPLPPTTPTNPSTPTTTTRVRLGCYTFDIGQAGGLKTLSTTGDASLDQALMGEMANQRRFWGVNVPFYLVDDSASGANAFYDPQHDIVALGIQMLREKLQGYGGVAIQGVLAHEMGHKIQFTLFPEVFQSWTRSSELEADCFSGFYMAYQGLDWSSANAYLRSTYSSGDYNFTDPNHHGTPDQRVAAALLGYNAAIYYYQQGYKPSLSELHQVFYGSVSRHVTLEPTNPALLKPTRGVSPEQIAQARAWLDTHHSVPLKNPIPKPN